MSASDARWDADPRLQPKEEQMDQKEKADLDRHITGEGGTFDDEVLPVEDETGFVVEDDEEEEDDDWEDDEWDEDEDDFPEEDLADEE